MASAKQTVDPQKEIEILVGELEERVDRLRALYEQYFLGYEKLEPAVARKDVDRRFVFLRKSQIRNTALRFRFNVVTQKFNTYAMYWTRVCRQIEEGTFKRHIQKAAKRFGPGATREQDFSIDVELGDFEEEMMSDGELDMDRVLAGAKPEVDETKQSNLAGIAYERDDTAKNKVEIVNDGATEPPPKSLPKPGARQPGFAALDDAHDTLPPPSTGGSAHHRVARHAAIPVGMKARVLLKKAPGSSQPSSSQSQPQPSSSKTEPAPPSAPELTPAPMTAGIRGRMPSTPDRAPPSTSVIRAATAQGHVHRSPPSLHRPGISPNAHSVRQVQVAKAHASDTQPPPATQPTRAPSTKPPPPSIGRGPAIQPRVGGPAASTNRIPAGAPVIPPAAATPRSGLAQPAATAAASANRVPVAQPAAAPSTNRIPVPAPSTNRIPVPAPSGRTPIGLPSGGSVGRMPVSATIPPPAAPAPPRPAAPAPTSERKIPVPAPSQRAIPVGMPPRPGGPMPAATPVRAPAPSVTDANEKAGGPPSRRPPPMLPSQVKKG